MLTQLAKGSTASSVRIVCTTIFRFLLPQGTYPESLGWKGDRKHSDRPDERRGGAVQRWLVGHELGGPGNMGYR